MITIMKNLTQPKREEYATKLTLIGIFLSIFGIFAGPLIKKSEGGEGFMLKPYELLMLALSTFRLGRMVSYDEVMEPVREPFTKTIPDSSGSGKTVAPQGKGVTYALGQLLSCPVCSGTWIAAGLVYSLYKLPSPTRLFMAIMSAIGAAELLNSLNEALSWSGRMARSLAGSTDGRGNGLRVSLDQKEEPRKQKVSEE